jgi:hypothetical protein
VPTLKGEEFFGELKEWSERKLNILNQYLDSFVKILGSGPKISQVYYVDAFAGAGIYQDGSLGSAMRAAQLASSYRSAGKSYQLKCINIEVDPENFANLQTGTQGPMAIWCKILLAHLPKMLIWFWLSLTGVRLSFFLTHLA